jgi:predicted RNA-binding protein YlxR (DUF448 family)
MTERRAPVRTCLVCMGKKPKRDLVRLVIDRETGCVKADPAQRMEGRGAYCCPGCLPKLRLDRRTAKAFRGAARCLSEGLGKP